MKTIIVKINFKVKNSNLMLEKINFKVGLLKKKLKIGTYTLPEQDKKNPVFFVEKNEYYILM